MDLPITIELPTGFLEEEIRCDYTVTHDYKELWAIEIDLLCQVDKVCKKLDIQYYACAGTLLGAVRHSGMIPWDDDIDIMMMRDDFDILCKHTSMFSEPYFLQTENTDKGSLRGHAQLRNSNTTGILEGEFKYRNSFNQGIFIDIFPLDYLPDNEEDRSVFLRKSTMLKNQFNIFRSLTTRYDTSEDSRLKKVIKTCLHPFAVALYSISRKNIFYSGYEKYLKKYQHSKTNTVGIGVLLDSKERFVWKVNDIQCGCYRIPFEFINIPVPEKYNELLLKTYVNWKKMVREPAVHSALLFDTKTPYTEYISGNASFIRR